MNNENLENLNLRSIKPFLDEDGKITQLPAKNKTKQLVLAYLAGKFAPVTYTEKEVNNIISAWHTFNDYFVLRRELVDNNFLNRTLDGSKYWKEKN